MTVLISFPGNEYLGEALASRYDFEIGKLNFRRFPDQESYIRYDGIVKNKEFAIVCTLDRPDQKFLPLIFLASLLKDLGAKRVGIIAPYLAYMRQDTAFQAGEAITSRYFARYISQHFDWIVSVDPHLHRYKTLNAIYTIPSSTVSASKALGQWIKQSVENPLIVGPDGESEQWVKGVAEIVEAPSVVFNKLRSGDYSVQISVPDLSQWKGRRPVIVDDVISSGQTILECNKKLQEQNFAPSVVAVVHPLFSNESYVKLKESVFQIGSSNTIEHPSNQIDLSNLIIEECIQSGFLR